MPLAVPGWKTIFDADEGKMVYWNENTKEMTSVRPKPRPPPVPARPMGYAVPSKTGNLITELTSKMATIGEAKELEEDQEKTLLRTMSKREPSSRKPGKRTKRRSTTGTYEVDENVGKGKKLQACARSLVMSISKFIHEEEDPQKYDDEPDFAPPPVPSLQCHNIESGHAAASGIAHEAEYAWRGEAGEFVRTVYEHKCVRVQSKDETARFHTLMKLHSSSDRFKDAEFPPLSSSLGKRRGSIFSRVHSWKRIGDIFTLQAKIVQIELVKETRTEEISVCGFGTEQWMQNLHRVLPKGKCPQPFESAARSFFDAVSKNDIDTIRMQVHEHLTHALESNVVFESIMQPMFPLTFKRASDFRVVKLTQDAAGLMETITVLAKLEFSAQPQLLSESSTSSSPLGVNALGGVASIIAKTYPDHFEKMFPVQENGEKQCFNSAGVYAIRIYDGRGFINIVVDDHVPCDEHGKPLFADPHLTPNGTLLIWPLILQKAIAKYCGGYNQVMYFLDENFLFSHLMGSLVERIDCAGDTRRRIERGIIEGKVVTARPRGNDRIYSIVSLNGDKVTLFDPRNNGEFPLRFADLVQLCGEFHMYYRLDKWQHHTVVSCWNGHSASGANAAIRFPQFHIDLKQDSAECIIQLRIPHEKQGQPFGILLASKVHTLGQRDLRIWDNIYPAGINNQNKLSLTTGVVAFKKVTLKRDDGPFCIVACTRDSIESTFVLDVYLSQHSCDFVPLTAGKNTQPRCAQCRELLSDDFIYLGDHPTLENVYHPDCVKHHSV